MQLEYLKVLYMQFVHSALYQTQTAPVHALHGIISLFIDKQIAVSEGDIEVK